MVPRMGRIYVESYGCTMNHGEARTFIEMIRRRGHIIVSRPEYADFIVVFTCTVVDYTEKKILKRLKELEKFKGELIIAGCMAAAQRKMLMETFPNTKLFAPTYYPYIVEYIDKGILISGKYVDKVRIPRPIDVIVTVPIAEGCNQDCAYCITKLARGRIVRSYPIDALVEDIKELVKNGVKEIRLSAQDTAVYGIDKGYNLVDLLREIVKIPGDFMIRVGMMNPQNAIGLIEDLIETFKSPKIYKFLHVPVQSGSERVLKLMKRGHGVLEYVHIVNLFRSFFEHSTISTDIIVGYPGETLRDFLESYRLIERTRPNIVNITRFSPRPFTEAAKLKNRVPGWIAKERSSILAKLAKNISLEENRKLVGKRVKALVNEVGKDKTLVARDNAYKPIIIRDVHRKVSLGSYLKIEIVEARETYLIGEII